MATVFAEVNVTNHSMDQIYRDMSSGNSLILDLIYFIISLTQIKNKSGPTTDHCGTPDLIVCLLDFDLPFITTICSLFHS